MSFNVENIKINYSNESFLMSYLDWNSKSQDIVLCLHGVTRNCRDFDYLAQALSEKYRVICPDIAGRGESESLQNKENYNYSTYCYSIRYLLNFLDIRKVSIIGSSMGGIIGMYLAAYSKSLVQNLILNDIGPFIEGKYLQKISDYINIYPYFNNEEEVIDFFKKMLSSFGIVREEHWQHICKYGIKRLHGKYVLAFDNNISYAFKNEIASIENMNLWEVWNKIVCKILVIRGSKSEILSADTLNQMLASKNNIDYIEYDNIGHMPSLMEENQIDQVKKWLNFSSQNT